MGAGRRREQRIVKDLPVRVRGIDSSGHPFKQTAYTVDISRSGARLDSAGSPKGPGSTLDVQHGKEKAHFRVVWIGEEDTPQQGQVGIQCLEEGKNIWGVPLPAPTSDDYHPPTPEEATQPLAPPPTPPVSITPSWAGEERRTNPRFRCTGEVDVFAEGSDLRLGASLSDISSDGCYLEMLSPLPVGTRVQLTLNVQQMEVQAKGVVRICHPSMGMGIRFAEMSAGDQERREQLINRLAGGPATEVLPERVASPPPLKPASDTTAAFEFLLKLLQQKGVLTPEEVFRVLERVQAKTP